ncbi:preprotein translocase subunit SecA [candidate division TA06 bacterium]|uniref:Protein translocase subunit SecA n=1 Tax=candidate division TA06 bacterium TaxID=2250710 RepID=A0A660SB03_UNCT6|nr:MAG: preprotein translocase subunit SecA [candidate division TA06 bacterium]
MIQLINKLFGSKNDRELKRYWKIVPLINEEYEKLRNLGDDELKHKTVEFKERLKNGETLDDLMVEAFAVVKDTCRRLVGRKWTVMGHEMEWNMIPFDVQLIGAIVLHEGKIAEMATGEGKTLVATMPLYLNALSGKGAHLVTVNDYLAQRDSEWMGEIYKFLGLTVGVIKAGMNPEERKEMYMRDITYGTNNEFGFDYLRDNMVIEPEQKVQRGFNYAIVDEVDSVLIDEARTPLIISGPVEASLQQYKELKPLVSRIVKLQNRYVNELITGAMKDLEAGNEREAAGKLLLAQRGAPKNKRLIRLYREKGVKVLVENLENELIRDKSLPQFDEQLYYVIDEKGNTVSITDKGREEMSKNNPSFFTVPDLSEEFQKIDSDERLSSREKAVSKDAIQREYAEKNEKIHNIHQLLKAYSLFERDSEYIVKDGKVIIVDEFTGRVMPGRRFSEGIHEAIEAKEGVKIEQETQTLATITLQNFFRMYDKLAGMTGTAETEAAEFWEIYKLDVIVVPTNRPVIREDFPDMIYRTKIEKYRAIIEEIKRQHEKGRPILVGTITVEVSEQLSRMLKRAGISHSVLNAKYHQKEAEIISHAGEKGNVTISTNMAGRGTDIKLGEGVKELGGLHVIGTERHESRRIDRQLRGRSGRQGDPGSSVFFISLEDNLMRLFASDRIASAMDRIGVKENEAITHPLITRAIENAQKRVEQYNFDIRKRLIDYDDVMNKQREAIYAMRDEVLYNKNPDEFILGKIENVINDIIEKYTANGKYPEDWDWDNLIINYINDFLDDPQIAEKEKAEFTKERLFDYLFDRAKKNLELKREEFGELYEKVMKFVVLQTIDSRWRDHLYELDALKEGIGLRGYAQRDPLVEYKKESYMMFENMIINMDEEIVAKMFRVQIRKEPQNKTEHKKTKGRKKIKRA